MSTEEEDAKGVRRFGQVARREVRAVQIFRKPLPVEIEAREIHARTVVQDREPTEDRGKVGIRGRDIGRVRIQIRELDAPAVRQSAIQMRDGLHGRRSRHGNAHDVASGQS